MDMAENERLKFTAYLLYIYIISFRLHGGGIKYFVSHSI